MVAFGGVSRSAYIVARLLGASFVDWIGVPPARRGLGRGKGRVSLALTLMLRRPLPGRRHTRHTDCGAYVGVTPQRQQSACHWRGGLDGHRSRSRNARNTLVLTSALSRLGSSTTKAVVPGKLVFSQLTALPL